MSEGSSSHLVADCRFLEVFVSLGGMNDFNEHYRSLLGLDDSWIVDDVDLDLVSNCVCIQLEHAGGPVVCSQCGETCCQADKAPKPGRLHRKSWCENDFC